MDVTSYSVTPVGRVESALTDPAEAPKQGFEGAPDTWITFTPRVADALTDIAVGDRMVVVTWLDQARRDVVQVHPRDDLSAPLRGVFSTRSADRPNPIGLHLVDVLAIDGLRLHVRNLEAVNGTPVLDLKPQLSATF